jgi:hypothetical protein
MSMLSRALSRRLLSTSYRGKVPRECLSDGSQSDAFRRARRTLPRRGTRSPSGTTHHEVERVLFRREEALAARFLGPLALFNVGGALVFCATIANPEDGGSDHGDTAPRAAACAVALLSAAGVVYAAALFNRRRLVEARRSGQCIRLYVRSMAGFPSIVLSHEVPLRGIAIDFSRLNVAAKLREDARGKRVTRKNDGSYVRIDVASSPPASYTIDAFDASILDTVGLENVAVNAHQGRPDN